MTLTFLGQAYEATTPEFAPAAASMTGMYRGNRCKLSGSHPMPAANVTLTYRGIRYTR